MDGVTSMQNSTRTTMAVLSLLFFAGCAVGPDFESPPAPKVAGYTQSPRPEQVDADAQHLISGQDIPGEWWQLFHSAPLNDLITEALKANPDLDAAQAALRQAQETRKADEGVFYPSIDANFSPSRQKQSNTTTSNVTSGTYVYNLFATGANVSYTPDVFGGQRRAVEALQAQEDTQKFQLEATYLTLTSNLVAGAVQEASLRGQITATESIIADLQHQLDLLNRQKALGEAAGIDVLAQETLLAQTEQTLPNLQKQLAQQHDLLTALTGHFPDQEIAQQFKLDDLQLPKDLPLTLPSKLVEQRPDIRAAEEHLHVASAEVGVAIANRLPQITLSGNIGSLATQIGQLITPGNGFWTLAGDVTQPVFEGGTLLHQERAARAAYDQAAAQYRSTVLAAFQNVADTLHALDADAKTLAAAQRSEHAAAKTLEITRKRLALGDIGHVELLTAEQSWQQAQIALVQAQSSRYTDTVALFQALGGGWWNREDIESDNKSVALAP
jgi:NodT family efflux transporter outer membrane factor (OMF) lipoprotein